jgi:hypothetical protein
LKGCPLRCTGNRGSGAGNVLRTVLLSVLNGHWRYAHINGVRGDGVNPGLLGMKGTVSEDVVCAAMKRLGEEEGPGWPSHVYHSYFVAGLRICLGVEVRPGREHAARHGLPGMWEALGRLPREKWPAIVWGDCGYATRGCRRSASRGGCPTSSSCATRRRPRTATPFVLFWSNSLLTSPSISFQGL